MLKHPGALRRRFFSVCVMAASLLVLTPGSHGAERPTAERAQAFMTELVGSASAALTAPGQTLKQREEAFRELLRRGFDMPFIARISLGRNWKAIDAADQKIFIELFGEFVLKTYAPRLGSFDPKLFHVESAEDKGRVDTLVNTRIDQAGGGGAIRAGWRLRLVNGEPRIVDIIVEGISMTLNQRSEFASVVSRDGVSGLIEMLRARTETLSVEPRA